MDPEDRDLLERTFKLARDNNLMLRSMNRAALFNNLFRVLAWAIVLGGSVWLYMTYLGPALGTFNEQLGQAQSISEGASTQIDAWRDLLDKLQQTIPAFESATETPSE